MVGLVAASAQAAAPGPMPLSIVCSALQSLRMVAEPSGGDCVYKTAYLTVVLSAGSVAGARVYVNHDPSLGIPGSLRRASVTAAAVLGAYEKLVGRPLVYTLDYAGLSGALTGLAEKLASVISPRGGVRGASCTPPDKICSALGSRELSCRSSDEFIELRYGSLSLYYAVAGSPDCPSLVPVEAAVSAPPVTRGSQALSGALEKLADDAEELEKALAINTADKIINALTAMGLPTGMALIGAGLAGPAGALAALVGGLAVGVVEAARPRTTRL